MAITLSKDFFGKIAKETDRSDYFTWKDGDIKFIGKKVDKILLVKYNPYHGEHGYFASEDEGKTDPGYEPVKPSSDYDKFEQDSHEAWHQQLTGPERGTVKGYTGIVYQEVNGLLRDQNPKLDSMQTKLNQERIKLLDSALAKSSLEKDTVVYRGISYSVAEQIQTGKIFVDHGYVSTSLDHSVSQDFGGSKTMQISVPKGTQAGVINGMSSHPDEHEVLLPRGSYFHIDKVTSTTVYARVLRKT